MSFEGGASPWHCYEEVGGAAFAHFFFVAVVVVMSYERKGVVYPIVNSEKDNLPWKSIKECIFCQLPPHLRLWVPLKWKVIALSLVCRATQTPLGPLSPLPSLPFKGSLFVLHSFKHVMKYLGARPPQMSPPKLF